MFAEHLIGFLINPFGVLAHAAFWIVALGLCREIRDRIWAWALWPSLAIIGGTEVLAAISALREQSSTHLVFAPLGFMWIFGFAAPLPGVVGCFFLLTSARPRRFSVAAFIIFLASASISLVALFVADAAGIQAIRLDGRAARELPHGDLGMGRRIRVRPHGSHAYLLLRPSDSAHLNWGRSLIPHIPASWRLDGYGVDTWKLKGVERWRPPRSFEMRQWITIAPSVICQQADSAIFAPGEIASWLEVLLDRRATVGIFVPEKPPESLGCDSTVLQRVEAISSHPDMRPRWGLLRNVESMSLLPDLAKRAAQWQRTPEKPDGDGLALDLLSNPLACLGDIDRLVVRCGVNAAIACETERKRPRSFGSQLPFDHTIKKRPSPDLVRAEGRLASLARLLQTLPGVDLGSDEEIIERAVSRIRTLGHDAVAFALKKSRETSANGDPASSFRWLRLAASGGPTCGSGANLARVAIETCIAHEAYSEPNRAPAPRLATDVLYSFLEASPLSPEDLKWALTSQDPNARAVAAYCALVTAERQQFSFLFVRPPNATLLGLRKLCDSLTDGISPEDRLNLSPLGRWALENVDRKRRWH